jgi:hypothetical protein
LKEKLELLDELLSTIVPWYTTDTLKHPRYDIPRNLSILAALDVQEVSPRQVNKAHLIIQIGSSRKKC